MRQTRTGSLVIVTATYVVAVAVGLAWLLWGPGTGQSLLDALVADVLATLVVFVASRGLRNSSLYDAYWSVVPPLLLVWWWTGNDAGPDRLRGWLGATVMMLWAVRLTGNWVRTWPGLVHEDWRYAHLRSRAPRLEVVVDLVAIHMMPTLQVFLAMVPVWVVMSRPGPAVGWLDWIAVVLGLGAVAVEAVADLQMQRFTAECAPGEVMDRGLWSVSRHPNYLGELGFWVAMALFGIAAWPASWWWLGVGALGILAILRFASIPMMEQRSLERKPDYQRVVERVPMLFPRPRLRR